MTNVVASQDFYAQFGFAPYGTSPSGRPGLVLACNSALFDEHEWRGCRERVTDLGLTRPKIELPRPHASKTGLSSTGRLATAKVTTRAQIAVLVQLFGLIVLLAVDRPYNWLGAFFILWSGILYRRERKRQQMALEADLRKHYGYPHSA